jgi:nitroreductase
MGVRDAIQERRAYRSLDPVEITESLVQELTESVRLAPSCFNSQPWRFVFVSEPEILGELHEALSEGNAWARAASLIIAVFSREQDDCIIRDRVYHQFDTGMGVGFLLLRAAELGLVAHPIAGFSPKKTREVLSIPQEYQVITLIIVGKHARSLNPVLSEKQIESEHVRPERKPVCDFVHLNRYSLPG